MNVQDVSVISAEAFAALQTSAPAPEIATEVALSQETSPTVTPPAEEPEEQAAPEQPDVPPAPPEVPPETVETAPEPPTPPAPPAPTEAEPEPPAPQQSDRVAAEAVPAPEPEAEIAPETQEAVTEDGTDVQETETQDATAPEEAARELATEADIPSTAMTSSLRPPANRPARPVQTAQPAPAETVEPEAAPQTDDLASAVASAVAEAQRPAAPSGPPLTGGELEGLRVAVGQCWNVGTLSTEAQETAVTVYVRMNEDGTPALDSMRMLSFTGGTAEAAARVYRSARSAIARCGRNGFPLPREKYGRWQEIEMTFNPEGMFWR